MIYTTNPLYHKMIKNLLSFIINFSYVKITKNISVAEEAQWIIQLS